MQRLAGFFVAVMGGVVVGFVGRNIKFKVRPTLGQIIPR